MLDNQINRMQRPEMDRSKPPCPITRRVFLSPETVIDALVAEPERGLRAAIQAYYDKNFPTPVTVEAVERRPDGWTATITDRK